RGRPWDVSTLPVRGAQRAATYHRAEKPNPSKNSDADCTRRAAAPTRTGEPAAVAPAVDGTRKGKGKRQKGKRPRPERGAKSPSESERGWGPASSKRSGQEFEKIIGAAIVVHTIRQPLRDGWNRHIPLLHRPRVAGALDGARPARAAWRHTSGGCSTRATVLADHGKRAAGCVRP